MEFIFWLKKRLITIQNIGQRVASTMKKNQNKARKKEIRRGTRILYNGQESPLQ